MAGPAAWGSSRRPQAPRRTRVRRLLPSFWTPLAFSRTVKRSPSRTRCWPGWHVVLWRDRDGTPHARDQCPHRGDRLSRGTVMPDGTLQCPFQRLAVRRGRCLHPRAVQRPPVEPDQLESHRAGALPCAERGGMVWVFTEVAPDEVPPLPAIPDSPHRPRLRGTQFEQVWSTHWTRAMENMLDAPHLPYVHRRTIGAFSRSAARGWRHDGHRGAGQRPRLPHLAAHRRAIEGSWLDWYRPHGMVLNIPVPGRVMRMHVYCVPEGPDRVRMMLTSARSFGLYNPLFKLTDLVNARVLSEDRRVLEDCQPPEVPRPRRRRA
ncbi:MAG: Rieske 2Fe-2S domain-containing protein [Alphaproteobacteria bacterium]|nr:Rieske 2Fe-2S domain-containing protein [Alphaproteobacteria bacterium]